MAIVINGSGTVTGLAVGGLPDGTVDAGTLATDSVVAAKLKSDAIAVADLPAGSVLQVVSDSSEAQQTISAAGWVDTALSVTITPSSTASKIHLQYSFRGIYSVNPESGFAFRIMRGSTPVHTPTGNYEHYHYSTAVYENSSDIALDSPATTSAVTYTVQIGGYTSATVVLNYSNYFKDTLIAMEIAG